jgi:hypothetical protein
MDRAVKWEGSPLIRVRYSDGAKRLRSQMRLRSAADRDYVLRAEKREATSVKHHPESVGPPSSLARGSARKDRILVIEFLTRQRSRRHVLSCLCSSRSC